MPHSTNFGPVPGADGQMAGMLDMYGDYSIPDNFDTTGNADDAIDYADLDDDESLPEEEEATNHHLDDEDEEAGRFIDAVPNSTGAISAQNSAANAVDVKPISGDLFDDAHEDVDLFGEHSLSPEEERRAQPPSQAQAQAQPVRPPGLALPSKTGLALPRQIPSPAALQGTSSISPPPFVKQESSIPSPPDSPPDDGDDDDLDEESRRQRDIQRELFMISKKRNAGEDVPASGPETDFDAFHQLFSGYEEYQAPRFVELFPPREIQYRGKEPLKPPKPVIPSKLTLDILPDQERTFKTFTISNKAVQDSSYNKSFVHVRQGTSDEGESDGDFGLGDFDEDERIGNVTMRDLALICEDWDIPSLELRSVASDADQDMDLDGGWDAQERARPTKRARRDEHSSVLSLPSLDPRLSFDDPERMAARIAKSVVLDLNDRNLLIDEHPMQVSSKIARIPGEVKRDSAASRDLFKRYNISNDQAYDLLKENHQNKVRSTLGNTTVEHSFPAILLQYPFYKVGLDVKAKRSFHRPPLELKSQPGREYRFQKPRHIKKKHWRGKEAKEVYAKAEDLSLGDNASILLLEYSEEAPMMISNFGMGNRLINYYRKRDSEDQDRPKREIGETQVLLTQDKSPFSTFGYVDSGELVPTIQNGLFRAPVFPHNARPVDFIIGISSTYEMGDRLYLRNVENLHVVGQQFPSEEIPGQHSRKVTDAAKKRLRALAYRIYTKSLDRRDKVLDNATLLPHLPGHDMPQTRSKMREFMKYEKSTKGAGGEGNGVWVPMPGAQVPDAETLRGWIKPEAVCVLDSMQVGVQHLADLGISETKDMDDDKDVDEGANIELQLAPWRATKNFLNACQSKAMLKLHGEGDPTGRGEGFSFVKTSMKGGFTAFGESVEDKIDARRRKENGGHSYNVAKQQKAYEDSIRRIWDAQKASLSREDDISDDDMDNDVEMESSYGRAATPRSSFGGAPSRHEDDSASQFSGASAGRGEKTLVITRKGGYDKYGQPMEDTTEVITDPRVIALYQKRRTESKLRQLSVLDMRPTGDTELDAMKRQKLEAELARVQRNIERREAREKAKGKHIHGAASAAESPGPSDADGLNSTLNADSPGGATPLKGKGRSKDGTARKCANCGQVGHIKTNRKLCPLLNGTMKPEDAGVNGDTSFGAVPAPLTL